MNIIEIKSASPINRLPGGEVTVQLEVVFENDAVCCGFANAASATNEDISTAIDEAITDAISRATKQGLFSTDSSDTVLADVIATTLAPQAEKGYKTRKEDGAITEEEFKQLYEPADHHKQKDLDNLCDGLGITRIDAKERGWNMLEAISVISALGKYAKRLESK